MEPSPASSEVSFRRACSSDLPDIVRMLADDVLGATRERFETPLPQSYRDAFDAIDADPNHELVVACRNDHVVGVMQIIYLPHLTHQGGWRALIEGVRVDAAVRALGIGRAMFEWAIQRARGRGCHLVQLTSDKARPDALRFYRSLGFVASHEGMKLDLTAPSPAGA